MIQTSANTLSRPVAGDPAAAATKERIEFIDLAKGVCIIMVVMFHVGVVTPATPLLSSMRMPLYFFLSGLFFKTYGGLGQLALRKADRILVPMLFFGVVGEMLLAILDVTHSGATGLSDYCTGVGNRLSWDYILTWANYPLWFLIALFEVNILYCIMALIPSNRMMRIAAIATLCLAGIWISAIFNANPLYLGSALMGLPFFCLGSMARRVPLMYPRHGDRWSLPLATTFLAIALGICILSDNSHVDIAHHTTRGNFWAAYIIPVFAVAGLLMLCKAIGRLPVVSYLGRYSIMVLGLHVPILWILYRLFPAEPSILYRGAIAVATLAICLAIIPFLRRYAPRLTAQADLLSRLK